MFAPLDYVINNDLFFLSCNSKYQNKLPFLCCTISPLFCFEITLGSAKSFVAQSGPPLVSNFASDSLAQHSWLRRLLLALSCNGVGAVLLLFPTSFPATTWASAIIQVVFNPCYYVIQVFVTAVGESDYHLVHRMVSGWRRVGPPLFTSLSQLFEWNSLESFTWGLNKKQSQSGQKKNINKSNWNQGTYM